MNQRLTLQTPLGEAYLEDGIIYTIIGAKEISLDMAKEHVRMLYEIWNDHLPAPVMSVLGDMKNISKETRDYLASEESTRNMRALALVVNSSLSKIVGNLFLQFSRPRIPNKLFTDKGKALEWLRQFKR